MDFPRTVDEITPEWLTQVLRESGVIGNAVIDSFELETLTGGSMGVVTRVRPSYKNGDSEYPQTLICKLASADDELRIQRNNSGFAERETKFYREMSDRSSVRVPRVFFADHDNETGYKALLLEDMGHLRFQSSAEGCSFEDALNVVRAAAGMHAKWWGDEDLLTHDWLVDYADSKDDQWIEPYLKDEHLDTFLEISAKYLPAEFSNMFRKFAPKYSETRELLSRDPLTLTHGDFRVANLLFDDSVQGPESVVVVDWEAVGRSRGAYDIASFLGGALHAETRRLHEHDLLQTYHRGLIDNGVDGYSYDEFIFDYRVSLLVRCGRLSTRVIRSQSMPADIRNRRTKIICEAMKSTVDWNCDEVIPK